jgi:hypothetical protein
MVVYYATQRAIGVFADSADSCIILPENLLAMHFLRGFQRKYHWEKLFTKSHYMAKKMISFSLHGEAIYRTLEISY